MNDQMSEQEEPGDSEQEESGGTKKEAPSENEQYCTDCGSIIKKNAEICPECGVRQASVEASLDRETRELKKVAERKKMTAALLGVLVSPAGYYYAGSLKWTLINLLTLNYFFLGLIIVPLHSMKMIDDAREKLDEQGTHYQAPD